MKSINVCLAVALASGFAAGDLGAQGRGNGPKNNKVPPGHLPPAGLCRIWIEGVPPGRQSEPTSCAIAERDRPANGRVIYGRDNDGRGRADDRDTDRDTDKSKNKNKNKNKRRGSNDERDTDRDTAREGSRDRARDRRGDLCVDANRDGRCDTPRQPADSLCRDRDRDGRCDAGGAMTPGATLPEMIGAILIGRGERSADVGRWASAAVSARTVDSDKNGVPERATWLDASGRVLQIWVDENRDGRADRVVLYRNGRVLRTVR